MSQKELLSRFKFIYFNAGSYRVIYTTPKFVYYSIIHDAEIIDVTFYSNSPTLLSLLELRDMVKRYGIKKRKL